VFTAESQRILDETFIRHVEWHAEAASTNDLAVDFAGDLPLVNHRPPVSHRGQNKRSAASKLPALIVAERQTAGRGRGENRWWSSEGGLTFSLIVDGETAGFTAGADPRVALLAGLAVADVLAELLPRDNIGLKWPNDVYLNGRKVCGILTEVPPARRDAVVVGIGINVNNRVKSAPDGLHATATSLREETGREFARLDLLIRVCRNLEHRCSAFRVTPGGIRTAWQRYCLLQGREVSVQSGSHRQTGLCRGIDESGALVLDTESGRRTIHSASQVRPVEDIRP